MRQVSIRVPASLYDWLVDRQYRERRRSPGAVMLAIIEDARDQGHAQCEASLEAIAGIARRKVADGHDDTGDWAAVLRFAGGAP